MKTRVGAGRAVWVVARAAALFLAFASGLFLSSASARAAPAADARFRELSEEFLGHWLGQRPHTATRLGLHDKDGELRVPTDTWLSDERDWLRGYQARLDSFARATPRAVLSFDRRLEYDVLRARVQRERLDAEVLRPFENNPNSYLALVAGSIQSLLDRRYAGTCTRLRSATRRLSVVPEVLRAAKINLRNPPEIATRSAIGQFEGVLRLYRERLPEAAEECRDPAIVASLTEADSEAVRAVESFVQFLREDLLPRSHGEFAIGRETYQRKLAAEEMETAPVESLLARGRLELERHRARMTALAERIAPGRGVPAALESLAAVSPTETSLVPFIASRLDSIRAFVARRGLLTPPAHEDLRVRETPPHSRSLSFASMDSPGVWEQQASEAYYNVTPPEPGWSEEQKRSHLAFFNRWASDVVSIHEALPGHYYQFLALRRSPSRIRQAFTSGSYTEGWAHYCEQMVIEQGFGDGDPRYELAQQWLALQRLGRLIVGISLHTQGMTYDEAESLFRERCWMAPVNASREARRGTMDPTYLVYTLGKWRILDLRDEVRARLGDRFDLKTFHDALLRQGASPLPVVREGVLHDLGLLRASRPTEPLRTAAPRR